MVTHTDWDHNNHNAFLYFFLFSLFGNPRINIFIYHITWHDAPKFTLPVYRNTLNRTQGFTMDTRLTFCPLHLQQWMTGFRFFVLFSFFNQPLSFSPHYSADHIHQLGSLRTVWQCHILFCKLLWKVVFFFLFVICFTSTICIETIHKLDTVPIRTFVPLLLTANTDQPRTLCLCNNNARLILIIRFIMTLITVVINFYFVYTKVGNRYGMGMHMTAVLETQKLYRSMSLYLH